MIDSPKVHFYLPANLASCGRILHLRVVGFDSVLAVRALVFD